MVNRQERRKREREIEKDMNILRKLPEKELLKINEIINKIAESKSEEALNIIDRSFSAVLVNEGWTFKNIKRIQDIMSEFMIEDQEKIKLLKKENVDMAKLQEEVREFMVELIKSDKSRPEVIKETIFKFPKLSKTAANNAYGKIQEELEIEDAVNYIFEDTNKIKTVVKKEEAKKVVEEVSRQVEKEIAAIKPSKLKIKKIELEGEFGSYIREGNKVIAGEIIFNSLEELQEYKRKEIELFNLRMKEIEDVYNAEVS